MASTVSEESGVGRSIEELSTTQQYQSSDALVEWRSSEQVENGTPSTSPPYWDTDDSDDDGGLKPPALYGKHTWKIEKFSQINKRELRSTPFEAGGYKWYILIYPQGCDVCNHLSLFLCVANHDKLLPGWSHFAQFTIAVVNKDPKKSKYSDTLHRFWKKEHDWGWKKFMELSKVSDGFVDADTLIIKAQVQVIREKVDRPFRCLDCQYRRELVRVYLTNVEQICRRFVEERRGKLGKLIEDKARWSSFCAFWLGMDQSARRRMSRENMDMILKVVVKHFFIEKEVTSTLVMDSLYSGLKALEGQSKGNKGKGKLLEGEDTPGPIVRVDKDMFVLVDDILLLLERASMEPLPPKDEKGPQNRTKDGGNGEDFNKDSIERDERRLTELGRRTVEIFVLAHIFSNKVEVAYQEAVALKRQEELIREEEAAWLVESEQKAKRGAEKDRKSKKKQAKQKRNNRKGKDKAKDEKPLVAVEIKHLHESAAVEEKDMSESQTTPEKDDALEDVSDVSDSAVDVLQPGSEDRDASPVNWDTDTSEVHPPEIISISTTQNGGDKGNSSVMDDSSSSCSTDSAPSVVMNGSSKSNSFANYRSQKSPTRTKGQQGKVIYDEYNGTNGAENRGFQPADISLQIEASSHKAVESQVSEGAITSLQDTTKWPELGTVKKNDEVVLLQRKPSNKDNVCTGPSKEKTTLAASQLAKSPPKNTPPSPTFQPNSYSLPLAKKISSNGQLQPVDKPAVSTNVTQTTVASKPNPTKTYVPKVEDKHNGQQAAALSRPSSAPLVKATVQSMAHPYIPQSYRNAIIGNNNSLSPSAPSFSLSSSAFSQQPGLVQAPLFLPQATERMERSSSMFDSPTRLRDISNFDMYRPVNGGSHELFPSELSAGTSGRQLQGGMADEFPHLDIINDLLDDDQGFGRTNTPLGHTFYNRQYAYPNEVGSPCRFDRSRSLPEDGFYQQEYCSSTASSSHYNSVREYIPLSNSLAYMNGQIDSLLPNQWQMLGPDLSLLGMRNSGVDGYPYSISDYSDLNCSVNGYTMFRPSNGH